LPHSRGFLFLDCIFCIAYNKRLNKRLENQNQEEMENVEQDWQNIKAAILEAAKETIQMQPRAPYKEWWDEECRKAIEEKNIERKKCPQRRTRATQEEYEDKRRVATKICRNKKKHWLNDRIRRIEEVIHEMKRRNFIKASKPSDRQNRPGCHYQYARLTKETLTEKQQVF